MRQCHLDERAGHQEQHCAGLRRREVIGGVLAPVSRMSSTGSRAAAGGIRRRWEPAGEGAAADGMPGWFSQILGVNTGNGRFRVGEFDPVNRPEDAEAIPVPPTQS